MDRDHFTHRNRPQPEFDQWERRELRKLLEKRAVLQGMIDEYEQDEWRRQYFGGLFSDVRGVAIVVATVVNVGAAVYNSLHH